MSAVTVSPRTSAEPMAFTRAELGRGALWTWLVFLILLTALTLVPSLSSSVRAVPGSGSGGVVDDPAAVSAIGQALSASLYATVPVTLIGGTVSGLVTLVMLPVAGLLGRRLRTVRTVWKHVACYTLLGAATGAVVTAGIGTWLFSRASGPVLLTLLTLAGLGAALTGVSAALGWWITMRRALRGAAPRPVRPALEPPALLDLGPTPPS